MKILQPELLEPRIRLEKEEAHTYLKKHKKEDEDVVGCHFVGMDLDEESLDSMTFKECIFENCRLMECKLEGSSWIRNEWISCDLSGSYLTDIFIVTDSAIVS